MGIPYTTIKSMLTIGTNPGYDSLLKIITAFPDISLKWLILGDDDMLCPKTGEQEQSISNERLIEKVSGLMNIIETQQSTIHELTVTNTKLVDKLLKKH